MKKNYDKGKISTECKTEDWVYLRNQRRKNGLSSHFNGPFQVLSRGGPNVRLILRYDIEKIVHLNRCKLCPLPTLGEHLEIDTGEKLGINTDYIESDSQKEPESSDDETEADGTSAQLSETSAHPCPRRSGRQRQRPK